MNVVVAGGGSAGHIEPALALADAVRRLDPDAGVTALGTERGLDTTLIPARGYPLELIPPVPLPRRPSADLLRLPGRVRPRSAGCGRCSAEVDADVVVGFGGYVALPAYLGARGRVPIVVHEANARAGLANRVGARFAARVAAAVPGSLPNAEILGIPLRHSITELDRPALRAEARRRFGLPADGPGAARLRRLAGRAHAQHGACRRPAGARGARASPSCTRTARRAPPRVAGARLRRAALHRRDGPGLRRRRRRARPVRGDDRRGGVGRRPARRLRAAAARQRRAGAQRRAVVAAGGGVLVPDAELDRRAGARRDGPAAHRPGTAGGMGAAARRSGHADAAERLAHLVLEVGRTRKHTGGEAA